MRATVKVGTAKLLADVGAPVAAKTGTAEVVKGRRTNSLLTAYGPADDPEIAVTFLVEGAGESQAYALRAARQFLAWYFQGPDISPLPVSTPVSTASPSAAVVPTGDL
jgi:cell division protein FtsI/penicillin-binding protein 2